MSRAPLILDLLTISMIAILPLLVYGIRLAKNSRDYRSHKKTQIAICVALIIIIAAFEVNIRSSNWQKLAEPSPYFKTILFPLLNIHISIAVITVLLWVITIVHAFLRYSDPPRPNPRARWHKKLGWLGSLFMGLTAITGWFFYYLAFIAV